MIAFVLQTATASCRETLFDLVDGFVEGCILAYLVWLREHTHETNTHTHIHIHICA